MPNATAGIQSGSMVQPLGAALRQSQKLYVAKKAISNRLLPKCLFDIGVPGTTISNPWM